MHAPRSIRSLPSASRAAAPTSARGGAAAALAALGCAVAAAVPAPARAAVFADVVSSTPVTAFVPVQRRQCGPATTRSTDPAVVDGDSQPAGGAADAAGACRTVTVRTQRVVGYDVVYAIGGERHTVRLDRDPGARVELGVVAQAPSPAGRPVGRLAGPPVERVERPIGQPVPAAVDDGDAVPAPVYGYGEQAPIGARPAGTTTVIVERGAPVYGGWYDPYPYGYGYAPGYGYGYGYAPGWYGPSIGIGFWGGHRWGGGPRRWDGGWRSGPPKDKFPHRVGGGPAARR